MLAITRQELLDARARPPLRSGRLVYNHPWPDPADPTALPIGPLVEFLERYLEAPVLRPGQLQSDNPGAVPARELAPLLGVDRSTITKYLDGTRPLRAHAADRLAVALGTLPWVIWGQRWWQVPIVDGQLGGAP